MPNNPLEQPCAGHHDMYRDRRLVHEFEEVLDPAIQVSARKILYIWEQIEKDMRVEPDWTMAGL